MSIVLTDHAKLRMAQRGITQEEIKSVIDDPRAIKESFKERAAARKKMAKGTLEVIYRKSEGNFIIITCYWIKEA